MLTLQCSNTLFIPEYNLGQRDMKAQNNTITYPHPPNTHIHGSDSYIYLHTVTLRSHMAKSTKDSFNLLVLH